MFPFKMGIADYGRVEKNFPENRSLFYPAILSSRCGYCMPVRDHRAAYTGLAVVEHKSGRVMAEGTGEAHVVYKIDILSALN